MAQPQVHFSSIKREFLFDQIIRVLDEMPRDLREVFILTHYVGRTPEEISGITGDAQVDLKAKIVSADKLFFRNIRHL